MDLKQPKNILFAYLIFLGMGQIIGFSKLIAQHPADSFPIHHLCQVDLNRTATKLSAAEQSSLAPAVLGFKWQSDDATTLKWRPQGITAINTSCKKFVAVSWYGRYINYPFPCNGQNVDYRDRGSRVTFVDMSNLDSIRYRHVLLVDENYNTFYDMHAGGLMILNDTLYVPDSRGSIDAMYAFPLNQIKQIPASHQANFYNYGYLLAKSIGADSLPINPSFVSYDWDEQQLVVGTFQNCDPVNCTTPNNNTLQWYDPGNVNTNSPFYNNAFGNMQGLGSADNQHINSRKDIWVSTSYGPINNSELFTFHYDFGANTQQNQSISIGNNYAVFDLPPGIEDIHLSSDSDTIWTLTEFSPNNPPCASISSNERYVFAFLRSDIRPPGACGNDYSIQQNTINDSSLCQPDTLRYTAFTNYVAYAQFDKSDNTWVELNSLSTPLANKDRSVFMWMKQASPVSNESQVLLGINSSGGGNICNLQVSTAQLLGIFDGSTAHYGTTPVTNGQWHHVGYTYQESSGLTRIYVDGLIEFSFFTSQTVTPSSLFSLGQEYDSGLSTSNFLEGNITELSIWDTLLTAAEINLLMQESIQSDHPSAQHLVAYYPMFQTCGEDLTKITDRSGHQHHGTGYGNIAEKGIDILSVDRIDQIPGFNAADHFSLSWYYDTAQISTNKDLELIKNTYQSGNYSLIISRPPFLINDDWTITFDYSSATDIVESCEAYLWLDGNVYYEDTSTAVFTISNYLGCDSILTLNLSIIDIDTSVQQNGSILEANQDAADYQWLDCNANYQAITGETTQLFNPNSNGLYAVEISINNCIDTSGCIALSTINTIRRPTEKELVIYPNPTQESLYLQFEKPNEGLNLKIKTANGKQVPINIEQTDNLFKLQLDVPAGIYFLELASKHNHSVYKILVY